MSARINKRRMAAGGFFALLLFLMTGIPGVLPGLTNPASALDCDNLTTEAPAVGDDCNEDPVVPDQFQDWEDVNRFGADGQNQWYFDCLQTRLGVSRDDVRRYSELEGQGHDLRGIVISNTNPSDEVARDKLEKDGVKDVGKIKHVIRLSGFENTRGIDSDRCNPFGDPRSQVRLALLIPQDVNDMSKGVHTDRGVLGMCGNPFKVPAQPVPQTTPPPPGNQPPENPPPTTPPTVPPTSPSPTTPQPRCPYNHALPPDHPDCKPPIDNGRGGPATPPDVTPPGSTPGAGTEPPPPTPGPTPQPNSPAPDPNDGGYDSGSGDGNNTPGGSTCDSGGCSGGGSTPPSNDPEDSGQGGDDNTGMPPPPP